MNKQLRNAIEDLLFKEDPDYGQKEKLLRVIEVLVEQRDIHVRWAMLHRDIEKAILEFDAELIATLEGK